MRIQQLLSWQSIMDVVKLSVRRFPMTIACTIASIVIAMITFRSNDPAEWLVRILLGAVLGISLFVGLKLMAENTFNVPKWKYILGSAGIIILSLYSILIDDPKHPDTLEQFLVLVLATHLLISFSYFLRIDDNRKFWTFNLEMFVHFVLGAFYSIVLMAGLQVATIAIQELFEIHWYKEVHMDIVILVFGLVLTFYWTSKVTTRVFEASEESEFSRVIINMVKYIMIPLIIIYFIILYAYGLRILVLWSLPKGWVGKLCLGFSAAGIFTYLLNFVLPSYDKNVLLKKFKKYFFYSMIPVLVLLFVALYVRIHQYGFTVERYLALAAAFWLTLVTFYFILSPKDDLRILPASLFFTCVMAAVGPWNAWNHSLKDQIGRWDSLLNRHQLIEDGKIVPARIHTDSLLPDQITSHLYYFQRHNYLGHVLNYFPDTLIAGINQDSIDYSTVEKLRKYLNIEHWNNSPTVEDGMFRIADSGFFSDSLQNASEVYSLRYWDTKTDAEKGSISIQDEKYLVFEGYGRIDILKELLQNMPTQQNLLEKELKLDLSPDDGKNKFRCIIYHAEFSTSRIFSISMIIVRYPNVQK